MKRIDELIGSLFIFRCHCNPEQEEGMIKFGACLHPYYNERFNGIMCERCNTPVFLSIVNPAELKKGSIEEQSFFNAHVQLNSDKSFMQNIHLLRAKVQEDIDRTKELTPLDKLL